MTDMNKTQFLFNDGTVRTFKRRKGYLLFLNGELQGECSWLLWLNKYKDLPGYTLASGWVLKENTTRGKAT